MRSSGCGRAWRPVPPSRNGPGTIARLERGLHRVHLEAQVPAPPDEVVGVRAALEQQVAGRGPRFEVTLQLRVLADRYQRLGALRLDQRAAPADADLAAHLGFRGQQV